MRYKEKVTSELEVLSNKLRNLQSMSESNALSKDELIRELKLCIQKSQLCEELVQREENY